MQQRINERLKQLEDEYDLGNKQLVELEKRTAELNATLLRISGAIHVLKELQEQEQKGQEQD